jgi:hypothetical protein
MNFLVGGVRKTVKWPYHCTVPMLVKRDRWGVRFRCEVCGATRSRDEDRLIYR